MFPSPSTILLLFFYQELLQSFVFDLEEALFMRKKVQQHSFQSQDVYQILFHIIYSKRSTNYPCDFFFSFHHPPAMLLQCLEDLLLEKSPKIQRCFHPICNTSQSCLYRCFYHYQHDYMSCSY